MNIKHIDRIGVELEGGWRSAKNRQTGWHGDGSVSVYDEDDEHTHGNGNCDHECDEDCEDDCSQACTMEEKIQGECVSPALDVSKIATFVENNYPDDVDDSCGFHVHMSFLKDGDYAELMSKRFYGYFLRMMYKYGKAKGLGSGHRFWHRLSGQNDYCCRNVGSQRTSSTFYDIASQQINNESRGDARYHHLNFCKALHNTMEIRMLPMFDDAQEAVSAVHYLVSIIETFLNKKKKSAKVFKTEFDDFEPSDCVSIEEEIYLGEEVLCAS